MPVSKARVRRPARRANIHYDKSGRSQGIAEVLYERKTDVIMFTHTPTLSGPLLPHRKPRITPNILLSPGKDYPFCQKLLRRSEVPTDSLGPFY